MVSLCPTFLSCEVGPPPPSEAVLEVTYIEVVHAWHCVLHVVGLPESVAAVMAVASVLSQCSQTLAGSGRAAQGFHAYGLGL